jgi:hypothetical protein
MWGGSRRPYRIEHQGGATLVTDQLWFIHEWVTRGLKMEGAVVGARSHSPIPLPHQPSLVAFLYPQQQAPISGLDRLVGPNTPPPSLPSPPLEKIKSFLPTVGQRI